MVCAAQPARRKRPPNLRLGDRIVVTTKRGMRLTGTLDGFATALGRGWIKLVESEGWSPVYVELDDVERIERMREH